MLSCVQSEDMGKTISVKQVKPITCVLSPRPSCLIKCAKSGVVWGGCKCLFGEKFVSVTSEECYDEIYS